MDRMNASLQGSLAQGRGHGAKLGIAVLLLVSATLFTLFQCASLSTAAPSAASDTTFIDSLWLAQAEGVRKHSAADGGELLSLAEDKGAYRLAMDLRGGRVWSVRQKQLVVYDLRGAVLFRTDLPAKPEKQDDGKSAKGQAKSQSQENNSNKDENAKDAVLAVDSETGIAWLGLGHVLYRYDATGQLLDSTDLGEAIVDLDYDDTAGRLWLAAKTHIVQYDGTAQAQRTITLATGEKAKDIEYDGTLGGLWLALEGEGEQTALRRYDESGAQVYQETLEHLDRIAGDNQGHLWRVANKAVSRIDSSGAVLAQFEQAEDHDVTDLAALPHDFSLWLAGHDSVRHYDANGQLLLEVKPQGGEVRDLAWYADRMPPTLAITSPAGNSTLNSATPAITLAYSDSGAGVDPASLTLSSNNSLLSVSCNRDSSTATCTPNGALPQGLVQLSAAIGDLLGNLGNAFVQFSVDSVAPEIAFTPADGSRTSYGSIEVTGQMSEVVSALSVNGQAATVNADNTFSYTLALTEGANSITVTATDPAGNSASATHSVSYETGTPDPAKVATPLDPTVATPLWESNKFLYSGDNPVQTGADPAAFDAKRLAILRGQVLDRGNAPLAGVAVTVKDHPEYGQTLTRGDGWFDMAVNGGGVVTLNYQKADLLPVQRQLTTPWLDYVIADSVVMIALDAQVTAIDLADTSRAFQVAQGNPVTDDNGTRQATVFFPAGTTATLHLPDGGTQAITTLHVRATEYTVGDNGPQAMPGPLPPTSGYTYAVELSVDEAIAAGAKSAQFSQAVPVYIDNFLNFPVGEVVPAGYYDRDQAAWIPSDDGRIVKVLGVSGGMAQLDVKGQGSAATAADLVALGITDAELAQIAGQFAVGKSLWRVSVTHFSVWDFNWPYGAPPDAIPPLAKPIKKLKPKKPCGKPGCSIQVETRSLGQDIPVTGTPFLLHYRSERVEGYKENYRIDVPVTGANVPTSLKRVEVIIDLAGRRFVQQFSAQTNQRLSGKNSDAFGKRYF